MEADKASRAKDFESYADHIALRNEGQAEVARRMRDLELISEEEEIEEKRLEDEKKGRNEKACRTRME